MMDRLRDQALHEGLDFIELTDGGQFDWKRFILGQGVHVLQGASIMRFVATFLRGISDANRMGHDRWDFVAFTTNGTLIRFHPSRHQSAEVLYSATLEEWNVCGQQVARPPGARGQPGDYKGAMLTVEQAAHGNVSRHDKLGWMQVRSIIHSMAARHLGEDLVDVTDGREFQWWRYFANCGHQSPDIIGNGIIRVHIQLGTQAILVERVDGSRATILPTKRVTMSETQQSPPPSSGGGEATLLSLCFNFL
jgi:hypothetical protein